MNRGNFLKLMYFISKHDSIVHDSIVQECLCGSGSRNALYTSPNMQILIILADIVQKTICKNVKKAGCFSILVDECKDCSKKEQLSLMKIFLPLLKHLVKMQRAFVATLLIHLEDDMIVSQRYDGAYIMSGKHSGVQQRIKAISPQAIYIYTVMHTL